MERGVGACGNRFFETLDCFSAVQEGGCCQWGSSGPDKEDNSSLSSILPSSLECQAQPLLITKMTSSFYRDAKRAVAGRERSPQVHALAGQPS